ncbi:hypothetical protein DENSPDRAFT_320811 [Dentipellis sp. KUC8613]|nr:hypothetical protein DENSPDRAFT_320811 [Dentipellis sp. KUC8613]
MKPATFFTTILAFSLSIFLVAAAPLSTGFNANSSTPTRSESALAKRVSAAATPSPTPLTPLLGQSRQLFRAVTNDELTAITTRYPKGGSPTGHKGEAGDFASNGAIYAFADIIQADKWGQSFTTPKFNHYFLVTFAYTPSTSTTRKSFASGTPDWVTFVSNNYAGKSQPTFDIVEGPISVKSAGSFIPSLDDNHQMLHQLAFVSTAALGTLKITDVQQIPVKSAAQKDRFCPGCNLQ